MLASRVMPAARSKRAIEQADGLDNSSTKAPGLPRRRGAVTESSGTVRLVGG